MNKEKELSNLKRALKENKFCEDTPEDSDIYQLRVREGDLLLVATDGVFDNLFQDEIVNIVRTVTKAHGKSRQSALILSKLVAEAAQQKSKQTNVKTPFNVKKARAIIEFKSKQKALTPKRRDPGGL